MTKKDYVAIAAAILRARMMSPEGENARQHVAELIALELAADSPRFDRARFLAACGVQS